MAIGSTALRALRRGRPRCRARQVRRAHASGPTLENAASRVVGRWRTYFTAGDWVAVAETVADDMLIEDRRRVVNVGIRHGVDGGISDKRTSVELGLTHITFIAIATRRSSPYSRGAHSSAHGFKWRGRIIEIDADGRLTAVVLFDADDIERRLRGTRRSVPRRRSGAYAQTCSVVAGAYAALNRHELPRRTGLGGVDHRRSR